MFPDLLSHLETARAFGISPVNIAISTAAALLSWLLMSITLRIGLTRLENISARTATPVDDMVLEVLRGTSRWLMAAAAILIGLGMLDLDARWNSRVGQLWFVALAVQVALWLTRAVEIGLRRYEARHHLAATGTTQVSASATLLSWFLRLVLWTVVVLAVLSNLGVNITAFVASLGIGGVAVALAVQNILGDLFASLSIAVDKPFEVGDLIGVGADEGTVQYIGLKTTRLLSLSGEQIIMSNTDLLKQVVKNYKRMDERRVVFKFGITYDATPEQAEAVPGVVKRLVESDPKLRFSRTHLRTLGDSSLDYEVVYFVKDPGFAVYMDSQQRLNIGLMRELAAMGIEFAFPTRTVILSRPDRADEAHRAPKRPQLVATT